MKTDLTNIIFDDLMKDSKYVLKLYNALLPEKRKRRNSKVEIRPPIELLHDSDLSLLRLKIDKTPIFIIQANMSFEESELKEIAYCFLTGLQAYLEEDNLSYEEWLEKIYLESEFFILCTNVKTTTEEISLKNDIYRNPDSEIDLNFNLVSKCETNRFLDDFFKLCYKINSMEIYKCQTRGDVIDFIDQCIEQNLLQEYFSQDKEEKIEMIYEQVRIKQIELELQNQVFNRMKKEQRRNRVMDQLEILYEMGISPIETLDLVSEINQNISGGEICEWYSDFYRNK